MKRPRILVVEDETDLQELIRHHLARERYDVVTAGDGETDRKLGPGIRG